MHISLDSALGRDQRLNSLGETINSIAAPAAAYSLRSLTGGDPKVVRVRREGDNGEQDFTVSEINSGALVDYINTNGVFQNTGYESFSNASASGFTASNTGSTGFAVSDLPDGTSGTAISVSFDISITNGSPKLMLRTALDGGSSASNSVNYTSSGSKTATLTATGSYAGVGFTEGDAPSNFTVSNFKILGDGFVETWYDQSGSGKDATQTTASNQPQIVSSGSLIASNGSPSVFFTGDTRDDELDFADLTLTDASVFTVVNIDSSADQQIILGGSASTSTATMIPMMDNGSSTTQVYKNSTVGGAEQGSSQFKNGSQITLSNRNDAFDNLAVDSQILFTMLDLDVAEAKVLDGISRCPSNAFTFHLQGKMNELIIYSSDQSSKRTVIEANINSHYSIF